MNDCNRAIELDPKMTYAYRFRALVNLDQGSAQAALVDADRAVSLSPNSAHNLVARCRAYIALEKYDDAFNDCNAATAIDPTSDDAYFYRGRVETAQQKWSAAVVDLAKALKLNAGDTNAYYWLTKALMGQGAYPDALRAADLYIESDVDNADGHFMRAQIEAKLGDVDQARISATNAQRHYMIVNDLAGAAKAQALLNSLGKVSPSPAPP
jgi:tetratricopeptide (TPR) repeat protein